MFPASAIYFKGEQIFFWGGEEGGKGGADPLGAPVILLNVPHRTTLPPPHHLTASSETNAPAFMITGLFYWLWLKRL